MQTETLLPARHRLTVVEFNRMAEAGVFADEDRVELIDGDIFDMAPIGQGHAATVSSLTERLFLACAGRAIVWPQCPIQLGQASQPQPDLALLRRRADFYATGGRPGPADILLLIEVADSSLRFDQTVKLRLYARAGIAEYWIVDMRRRAVDAYRQPDGDRYAEMTTHAPGVEVALSIAPEIRVRLALFFE